MKEKIIQLLNDAGDYISGEQISNQLGVSRTAVWKVINQLKNGGYQIESITKKGYKLITSPDILQSEEIHYNLKTKVFGQKIFTYDTVGSTNEQAKKLALEGAKEGTLIISEEQSSGKGRRGKDWVSPPNKGIWMTLILRPEIEPQNASMLTLVAGLAVCKGIEKVTNLSPKIKWPNDIVIGGKKICGMLTEMNTEMDFVNFVIVGIGINVNNEKFPEEIDSIATSLMIQGGQKYERKIILKKILEAFEHYYDLYKQTEDLQLMIEEYNNYCINVGKEVKVINKKETITGKSKEITRKGELILIDSNGVEKIITSGEVSVRGLYGYV